MCRLIESIKFQDNQLQHIKWHNKRFNEARNRLFGMDGFIDLQQMIRIPDSLQEGIYKCRVLYGKQIETIDFLSYIPKKMRTLQLVEDNEIDYTYKYENRLAFERLLTSKGQADDILIVKNGHITDTSYSNMVFFDGEKWITPDTFLLNGTQRQHMLAKGLITEAPVTLSALKKFKLAKPINAMLDFETTPSVTIRL
ncbi:MAG: aminotransferase class IV [Bacteroidales bacterium]|nr:aminotransferase class IV [Bacteroidales bacterium]